MRSITRQIRKRTIRKRRDCATDDRDDQIFDRKYVRPNDPSVPMRHRYLYIRGLHLYGAGDGKLVKKCCEGAKSAVDETRGNR